MGGKSFIIWFRYCVGVQSRQLLEGAVEVWNRVEPALHSYLRNLHIADGQQFAGITYAHVRHILQESLFRGVLEETAKALLFIFAISAISSSLRERV